MVSLVPVEENSGEAGTSTSDELPPDQQIPKLQQQINRQFATDNYKAAGLLDMMVKIKSLTNHENWDNWHALQLKICIDRVLFELIYLNITHYCLLIKNVT